MKLGKDEILKGTKMVFVGTYGRKWSSVCVY